MRTFTSLSVEERKTYMRMLADATREIVPPNHMEAKMARDN